MAGAAEGDASSSVFLSNPMHAMRAGAMPAAAGGLRSVAKGGAAATATPAAGSEEGALPPIFLSNPMHASKRGGKPGGADAAATASAGSPFSYSPYAKRQQYGGDAAADAANTALYGSYADITARAAAGEIDPLASSLATSTWSIADDGGPSPTSTLAGGAPPRSPTSTLSSARSAALNEEAAAYGWIDPPPSLLKYAPWLLRACARHPQQKPAFVAAKRTERAQLGAAVRAYVQGLKTARIAARDAAVAAAAEAGLPPPPLPPGLDSDLLTEAEFRDASAMYAEVIAAGGIGADARCACCTCGRLPREGRPRYDFTSAAASAAAHRRRRACVRVAASAYSALGHAVWALLLLAIDVTLRVVTGRRHRSMLTTTPLHLQMRPSAGTSTSSGVANPLDAAAAGGGGGGGRRPDVERQASTRLFIAHAAAAQREAARGGVSTPGDTIHRFTIDDVLSSGSGGRAGTPGGYSVSVAYLYEEASRMSVAALSAGVPTVACPLRAPSWTLYSVGYYGITTLYLGWCLYYVLLWGLYQGAATTESFLRSWVMAQVLFFFVLEPLFLGLLIVCAFILMPAALPFLSWIPCCGAPSASEFTSPFESHTSGSGSGDELSGRLENLTLVKAAGYASACSPDLAVVGFAAPAALASVIGGASRRHAAEAAEAATLRGHGHKTVDALALRSRMGFSSLGDAERYDLVVKRYAMYALRSAEEARRARFAASHAASSAGVVAQKLTSTKLLKSPLPVAGFPKRSNSSNRDVGGSSSSKVLGKGGSGSSSSSSGRVQLTKAVAASVSVNPLREPSTAASSAAAPVAVLDKGVASAAPASTSMSVSVSNPLQLQLGAGDTAAVEISPAAVAVETPVAAPTVATAVGPIPVIAQQIV